MNETTERLIRELAEKLGTTTDHLWEVLVKQASVNWPVTMLQMILAIGLTIGVFKAISYKTKVPTKTESNPYPSAQWEDEKAFWAWGLFALLAVLSVFLVMFGIESIVTSMFNPEYWALDTLITKLKSK